MNHQRSNKENKTNHPEFKPQFLFALNKYEYTNENDNCIYLGDGSITVETKVRGMFTDPARKKREDKGHPEVCPVFFYHKLFNQQATETVATECREAKRGCVDCKMEMFGKLDEFLEPIREKRNQWLTQKSEVREILDKGRKEAQKVASQTLAEALTAVGIRQ